MSGHIIDQTLFVKNPITNEEVAKLQITSASEVNNIINKDLQKYRQIETEIIITNKIFHFTN